MVAVARLQGLLFRPRIPPPPPWYHPSLGPCLYSLPPPVARLAPPCLSEARPPPPVRLDRWWMRLPLLLLWLWPLSRPSLRGCW